MQRDVITVSIMAPMIDKRCIAVVMLDHGVDGVPIMREGKRLVGFISRSDILRAVIIDLPLSL